MYQKLSTCLGWPVKKGIAQIDFIHDIRHLCTCSRIDGIRAKSRGISGGKQVINLPIQVIAVEFVYSIKTRRQIPSHAQCTYRVLARFGSLLFAMRTSSALLHTKKGLHFLLPRINKLNRDFFHRQMLSLVCPLGNHVTLLLSHQSLCACKDSGYHE